MIYRAYTSKDLAAVVRLCQETVHTVCAADYTPVQLDAWAPKELDMKNRLRLFSSPCPSIMRG